MSSAMNHRRRSHKSELRKEGMYRASMSRAYYSSGGQNKRLGVLGRILRLLRREKKAKASG